PVCQPLRRRPVYESVSPENLIVSDTLKLDLPPSNDPPIDVEIVTATRHKSGFRVYSGRDQCHTRCGPVPDNHPARPGLRASFIIYSLKQSNHAVDSAAGHTRWKIFTQTVSEHDRFKLRKSDCASAALWQICGATPRFSSASPSLMRRKPLVV